nr:putative integrase/recombinase protein [Schizostauron trachyderma]
MENQIQKIKKENNQIREYKKLESQLGFLLHGQKINREELRVGFRQLADQNRFLSLQNQQLLDLNQELKQQLKTVVEELNRFKKERQEKAARKEARANRKRLPKRDPMTAEIYKELIKETEGPTYLHVRLRLALCLLTVTGVRINELLPLKANQLETLLEENWIAIDRSKRGPSNHKAFLTKEGKKIIQDRKKDFELIFLMKESDSYVFTSESTHDQMLSRETITRDVNKIMRSVSKQLPGQPNVTSHSFRIGYITQLWKDSKDIEFVKQSIGHQKLDTTSAYVTELSDREREKRIEELK